MSDQCAVLIDSIVKLRKEKGWTQKQLSSACGLTQSVVARIESKKSVPTIATLYRIVDALGASLTVEEAENDGAC